MVVSLISFLAFSNEHVSKKSAKRGTKKISVDRVDHELRKVSRKFGGGSQTVAGLVVFLFFCVVSGFTQDALFGEHTLSAAFLAFAPLLLPWSSISHRLPL